MLSRSNLGSFSVVLFTAPEGPNIDLVTLPFDRNDSTAEQEVVLPLHIAFIWKVLQS